MIELRNSKIIALAKQLAQKLELRDINFNRQNKINSVPRFEGRRKISKSGIGEDFYQYRPLNQSESRNLIDWRASAKGDTLQVKEHEIHAKNVIYVWLDARPSMFIKSDKDSLSKAQIGLIVALAITEIAKKDHIEIRTFGGPNKDIISALLDASLTPPQTPVTAPCLLLTDCMYEIEEIESNLKILNDINAQKVLGIINDAREIEFDFKGRVNFFNQKMPDGITIDDCTAVAADYRIAIEEHFKSIERFANKTATIITKVKSNEDYFPFAQSILNALFRA